MCVMKTCKTIKADARYYNDVRVYLCRVYLILLGVNTQKVVLISVKFMRNGTIQHNIRKSFMQRFLMCILLKAINTYQQVLGGIFLQ